MSYANGSQVDFKSSYEKHRLVINQGIDAELDEWKQTFEGLESILDGVGAQLKMSLPVGVQTELSVHYIPQLGYLIAILVDPLTGQATYVSESWEFQFSTEEHFYYKSHHMREMDDYYGDIVNTIAGKPQSWLDFGIKGVNNRILNRKSEKSK